MHVGLRSFAKGVHLQRIMFCPPPQPPTQTVHFNCCCRYTHFYDHGSIWANLREVLFPRCYEPDVRFPNARKLVPPTPGSIERPSNNENAAATNSHSPSADESRVKGKSKTKASKKSSDKAGTTKKQK